MTTPHWPEWLYRIVKTNPPDEDSFLSNWQMRENDIRAGRRPRPLPKDGEGLHTWSGVSLYASAEKARSMAQRYPKLGSFIVPLQVRRGQAIHVEQTGDDDPEHYDLWGTPATLLATAKLDEIEAV